MNNFRGGTTSGDNFRGHCTLSRADGATSGDKENIRPKPLANESHHVNQHKQSPTRESPGLRPPC
ncbi:hypothetical protein Pla52n_68280 [Stieleria varia]|uniref:Uncharacterized protein n=1 Tax=Stieleria varia TaxID=2528005 RepID=A0A5C5ZQ52_9BACT|nr:hypothetical protein Pla52n_68280 [Stieleria varia]